MISPLPNQNPTQAALHLIYASADIPIPNQANLRARIPHTWRGSQDLLTLNWTQQDPDRCLGRAAFGGHEVHIAGLALPLPPEVIDHTIMVSPWGAQTKAAMRLHRAHISLVYAGRDPDPIEQMIALYSLANALENEDLLGIVNINAWTAHPPADFLSIERITQYRQVVPFNLWIGYVRFYTDDQRYWLVTKGQHIFDVPDLAYDVQSGEDEEGVIKLFMNVFYYLYEQDVMVTAGDTLEIRGSGQTLQFSEVSELTDVLMGPSGTLVITKHNASD